MITGIENISRTKQKAVLEFISSEFDLDEAIKIEEEDDDIVIINGTRYFIIRPYEEEDLMMDLNDARFDEAFSNVSDEQRKYIDKDLWIEDKGIHDFTDYLKYELDEMPSEDYICIGNYHFYEL